MKEITSSICTFVKSKWLFFFFKKGFGEQELCIFIELQMCTISYDVRCFTFLEVVGKRKEEQGDILIVIQLRLSIVETETWAPASSHRRFPVVFCVVVS